MKNCVFCNVIKNEKEKILFQDSLCLVINDKYPVTKGHLLVIPKRHYSDFLHTPDKIVSHMFLVAKKIGKLSIKKHTATGINLLTNAGKDANQVIMHFHIHVVPRYPKGASKKPHHALVGAK